MYGICPYSKGSYRLRLKMWMMAILLLLSSAYSLIPKKNTTGWSTAKYQFLWTNYSMLLGLGYIFMYSNTKIWFVQPPFLPLPVSWIHSHLHLDASFLIAQLIQAIVLSLINMEIYRANVWGFTSKHGAVKHQTRQTVWFNHQTWEFHQWTHQTYVFHIMEPFSKNSEYNATRKQHFF